MTSPAAGIGNAVANKEANSPRVTGASGRNVWSGYPPMMPRSAKASIESLAQFPATSVNAASTWRLRGKLITSRARDKAQAIILLDRAMVSHAPFLIKRRRLDRQYDITQDNHPR